VLFQLFKCQNCNHRFEAEVLDDDDPKERHRPASRLRCPECRSTFIEVLRTIERRSRRVS